MFDRNPKRVTKTPHAWGLPAAKLEDVCFRALCFSTRNQTAPAAKELFVSLASTRVTVYTMNSALVIRSNYCSPVPPPTPFNINPRNHDNTETVIFTLRFPTGRV